jgi:integrase
MVRFDARAAKLLPVGDHIVVDGVPGLRLVSSTAGKSWIYRYKAGSSLRQIKIGTWPAVPLAGAIARWQEIKDQRDSGHDPALEKRDKRQAEKASVYTVAHAVEDYITGHLQVNREAKGAKAVAARLRSATEGIAKTPAASVTRRIAWDLIDSLADRPVLAKSVRNEMGGAWDLALDAGKLPDSASNWWRQIMSGKLRSKGAVRDGVHKGTDKRVLSETEITTLLTVDLKRFSQQVRDFLTIQLWTCTRGAEIVCMTRAQITHEADGWWWTLPKSMTKGKKREAATDLRVPLIGRALEVVQRIDTDIMFPSVSRAGAVGHQQQTYMQSKVHYLQPYSNSRPDHVCDRLTVTHWSPHDLRRTGRTMLAQLGCPTDVAESILGHVQPGVQGVYNLHKYDAERRHWLTLWSDKLCILSATVGNGQV